MSFLFASESAFKTAGDSLHFHGGYGYTLEYEIQLYFRRAKAWALAAGDPRREFQRLAGLLFDERDGDQMDFSVVDDLAEHREAARAWAEANVDPAWAKEQHESGTHQTAVLHRLLARDGLLGAGWAPEYGGTDVDPGFAHAVLDELRSVGLMWDGWSTTVMVINTISHVGSEEQKRTIIPAALRGELSSPSGTPNRIRVPTWRRRARERCVTARSG